MAAYTAKDVSELRQRTQAGMMDCKKALEENAGDMDKAVEWLRKKGISRSETRAGRTASEGKILSLISEGLQLLNAILAAGRIGEYQLVASIAALHDEAGSYASTRWAEIAKAYTKLESLTGNPMVRLNRAVAVAMVQGPAAGLALLEGLELHDSHRLHAVRAHLLEDTGDLAAAAQCYAAAAARTDNARERDYLIEHAARVSAR